MKPIYTKKRTKQTTPTAAQIKLMQKSCDLLIETFRPVGHLVAMINKRIDELAPSQPDPSALLAIKIKTQSGRNLAPQNWTVEGRIPYRYACVLDTMPEMHDIGLSLETMRPDVKEDHL